MLEAYYTIKIIIVVRVVALITLYFQEYNTNKFSWYFVIFYNLNICLTILNLIIKNGARICRWKIRILFIVKYKVDLVESLRAWPFNRNIFYSCNRWKALPAWNCKLTVFAKSQIFVWYTARRSVFLRKRIRNYLRERTRKMAYWKTTTFLPVSRSCKNTGAISSSSP